MEVEVIDMLETNVRIVKPGIGLYVWMRKADLTGQSLTPSLVQRACGTLSHRYGIAAVPNPDNFNTLLVASKYPVASTEIDGKDWKLNLQDAAPQAEPERLFLNSDIGVRVIPSIIERALIVQIRKSTDLWRIESPRIWYEKEPFQIEDGIAAYQRYEIGTFLIDGVGVGIAVDVGVAFFSSNTLDYFIDPTLVESERTRREALFERLTQRQDGQKGTLLYDNGINRVKCYFATYPRGMTCATTGAIRARDKNYDSLLAYYQATNPDLPIDGDTPAVKVSFKGLDFPQPVAASRVKIRVMNDNLPANIRDVDKINPKLRRDSINYFWNSLGPKSLGFTAPLGVENSFWRPDDERVLHFSMPTLKFGQGKTLLPPEIISAETYREHFQNRQDYLKDYGSKFVPPNITRTIYCAYPSNVDDDTAKQFAADLAGKIKRLTGKPITAKLVDYTSVSDAIEKLRDDTQSGMVVFVLNNEPSAYYEAEYQLSGWRIKRLTIPTLVEHYDYLTQGAWDKRARAKTLESGKKRWNSFVNLIALDVIQLLDVVPYSIADAGIYNAQLIIDVGHDWRNFAVSLLITRNSGQEPDFRIISHTQRKMDYKQEAINPTILADEIVALFSHLPRRFDPLESLLVMRDGQLVKQESEGLDNAVLRLKEKGYLTSDARVDRVDVHKDTLKSIRFWEVDVQDNVSNPLLGTGIRINQKTAAVINTGAPTLSQGTADPLLLIRHSVDFDVMDAARANFTGAQLNWSSPRVAQRLHVGMKRTDEDLKARSSQEIRRLR